MVSVINQHTLNTTPRLIDTTLCPSLIIIFYLQNKIYHHKNNLLRISRESIELEIPT